MIRRPWNRCLIRRLCQCQHPVQFYVRYGSSRSREPYILPRLAIDLDAHDNPYVRGAAEEDYPVKLKPPWRPQHHAPPKNQTEKKSLRSVQLNSYALDPHAITVPDLMAYALLGNPNATPTPENLALRKQFHNRKIHPLDNADTKIKHLLCNFTTDASKVLQTAGFTHESESQILEEIRNRASFDSLTRILSMLSSTAEGCKFIAINGDAVVDGIRRCRKNEDWEQRTTLRDVLNVLNNLRLNMRSKGVQFGSALCGVGVYFASKRLDAPLIRKYLQEKSYQPSVVAMSGMNALVAAFRHGGPFYSPSRLVQNELERGQEVLRLLTGWDSMRDPSRGMSQIPCFASSIRKFARKDINNYAYKDYVVALGYIGASDALRLEWEEQPEDGWLGDHHSLCWGKIQTFALAFLMAEDRNNALKLIESVFRGTSRPIPSSYATSLDATTINDLEREGKPSATASENPEPHEAAQPVSFLASESPSTLEEVQSASKPIMRSKAKTSHRSDRLHPIPDPQRRIKLSSHTRHKILWSYRANKMKPTQRLLNRLRASFLPDKPETVLQTIDDLLVPTWIRQKRMFDADGAFVFCDIDWVQHDGVEGIAILKGDETLYFKPSSQRASRQDTEKVSSS